MIRLPTEYEIKQFIDIINVNYLILRYIWAPADDLELLIHAFASNNKHNMFINGWKHTHHLKSPFVYARDGK